MKPHHLALLAPLVSLHAEPIPAFPGAEGAGALATGGRGGEVVHVTNLNADGPGSLGDAVSAPNRIVVFDVSGIIDLSKDRKGRQPKNGGHISITQPNITIAGQTTPGEGICIKGGALQIHEGNVIVRYLRSRRGWNWDGDSGDSIEIKARTDGEKAVASGQSEESFDKRKAKKAERGKTIFNWQHLSTILIDHCSASWATDENLTATHTDRTTVSWSIAAEGLDYYNPKQTPPNHAEGGLWGSGAPDGRATMHHTLFASNRLRNPRTTGDADQPAVLNFYNNVVYDWSEFASHTGQESVFVNWLNSFYKPGPSTPADIRTHMFEFHGDPGARIFARGNVIDGFPKESANNKLAIFHNQKLKKIPDAQKEAMKVDAPFPDAPAHLQTAEQAYAAVLADAGATLPARDAVDLRIVRSVRDGTGRVIEKETDFPESERWPDYRSLPPPVDFDHDGLPDFWEVQFGLDPANPKDSAQLAAGGYANIEHYFNNTDPRGANAPIAFVSASVSRANAKQPGEWKITRTGSTAQPLTVRYAISGEAQSDTDFAPLSGSVTIAAGEFSALLPLKVLAGARDNRMAVITLTTGDAAYLVGCPFASLIVVRTAP
jgi:hypothetical protein